MEDAQGGAQIRDAVLGYSAQSAAAFVTKQTLGPWQTKRRSATSSAARHGGTQHAHVPRVPATTSSRQHGPSSASSEQQLLERRQIC